MGSMEGIEGMEGVEGLMRRGHKVMPQR